MRRNPWRSTTTGCKHSLRAAALALPQAMGYGAPPNNSHCITCNQLHAIQSRRNTIDKPNPGCYPPKKSQRCSHITQNPAHLAVNLTTPQNRLNTQSASLLETGSMAFSAACMLARACVDAFSRTKKRDT